MASKQTKRDKVEAQAKALFPKLDIEGIKAIVEAVLKFWLLIGPIFMAFKPGDKAAKKFASDLVGVHSYIAD